jgi:iron complex outermembrane receptor protein/vitamin B12 transporter
MEQDLTRPFLNMTQDCLTHCLALICASIVTVGISASVAGAADEGTPTVVGRVLDPLGGTIPSAQVTLLRDYDPVAHTTSDASGHFSFAVQAAGRYRVHVEATGFASRDTDPMFVALGAPVTLEITLSVGTLVQEVTVTAAATALPASQVGAPVTVLDRDILQSLAKPDVVEALRLVPGVQVLQTGQRGGVTSLFVRGGNDDFNKVLIDGVPANDIGGGFDLGNLSITGIDRVEVLRNPNSVLYGADALTSVVAITTRRGTSRVPELTYAIDGGNLGTLRQELSVGGARDRIDYFGDISHFITRNNVLNDADHNSTFAGTFGWALQSSTRLAVTARSTSATQGVPNAIDFYGIPDDSSQTSRSTSVGVVLHTQATTRWAQTIRFASTDLHYHFVNPSPTGQAFDPFGFGPNYLGQTETISGANGTSARGQAILDFGGTYPQIFDSHTTRQALMAQTDYSFPQNLSLSAGFRIEDEHGTADSGSPFHTTRHNGGAFLEGRASLRERAYVAAGVGFDHNTVFGFAATPRMSVATYLRRPTDSLTLGGTKLTFNAGTGIKAPNVLEEQSSLFRLLNASPIGSPVQSGVAIPPIGPERSRSVDVGLEQGIWHERGRIHVSVFNNHYDDLIEFVSKSALPDVGVPESVAAVVPFGAYVNSSSYRARGIELAFEGKVGRQLTFGGAYTRLDAVVTRSLASSALEPAINPAYPGVAIGAFSPLVGGRPFRRAPNSGSLHAAWGTARGQLSVVGYFVGRADDSTFLTDGFFGNSLLLPNHDLVAGYAKLDASGNLRIHDRVRVYGVVENVLNQRYDAAPGFPALPVTVRAGLAWTLGGSQGSHQ